MATLKEIAEGFSWKEIDSLRSALSAHRRACGPSCFNGDQIAEIIRLWEEANDPTPEDESHFREIFGRIAQRLG